MLEFKLNYYFEKYKDSCVISLSKFRDRFIKENGDFPLINEVFIMIQKYQYKNYGDLVASGRKTTKEVIRVMAGVWLWIIKVIRGGSMIQFLVGCLCGFVGTIMLLFMYAALVVGGDKDE